MIFLTTVGVVEKTNIPPSTEQPLKRTKQPPESNSRARVRYSYPQRFPGRYRSNERLTEAMVDDRGRDGTHQPHRIRLTPALATTTHHPSPTTRPNHLPTLRSHHHLGHSRPANQPRSRPHHTRQPGRTQHPRQRANHLQNMQQKQRQQNTTKHSIPTTNHKKPCFMVTNPPTPHRGHPLHTRAKPRTA